MAIQTKQIDIVKAIAILTDVDRFCYPGYSYLHMAAFTKVDDIYNFIYRHTPQLNDKGHVFQQKWIFEK